MTITQNNIRRWSPRMSRNSQLESKIPQTHEENKGESAVDSRSPQKSQWAKALGGRTTGQALWDQGRRGGSWSEMKSESSGKGVARIALLSNPTLFYRSLGWKGLRHGSIICLLHQNKHLPHRILLEGPTVLWKGLFKLGSTVEMGTILLSTWFSNF